MMGGAESAVYPKAYAFFEKKRIFEGRRKRRDGRRLKLST
jgi:hypothetical protein